jgi:DNA-binding NtrC family response regulator
MKPKIEIDTFNLRDIEKHAVTKAVYFTKGNLQYASELLNISRMTLYRLLKEYKINYAILKANNWYNRPSRKRQGNKWVRPND